MDEETARIIGRMQRELETLRAIEISPIANSGWVATSVTWTYASASTFTVPGDVTATYQKGTFLRWKQGGGWKYGVVASSSYSAPNTTVTIIVNTDYTIANAAITDPWYSYAANPQGWPGWFTYTPTVTYLGGTTDPTSLTFYTKKYCVSGKTMHCALVAELIKGTGDRTEIDITTPSVDVDDGTLLVTQNFNGFNVLPAIFRFSPSRMAIFNVVMASDGWMWMSATAGI